MEGAFGDSYASRRRRRYRSNTRSRLYPTSWARRDTAPHCPLHTAAALPIHVTTDKLPMLVSLSFSGMMLPGDVQEVHVLDSRQIVNQNSDKKPHLETMSGSPTP